MSTGLTSDLCLSYLRQTLSDTDNSGGGRWTDSSLYGFIDRANKRVVRDVLFPDCRVLVPTVAQTQLYQFPLMIKVKAVYVAGQLLVPTDVQTLEGRQVGKWDSTSDGSTVGPTFGDQPVGSTGVGQPQWMVQTPLSYPDTNGMWTTPKPDAQSSCYADPPRYYWRGGWLGLCPAPSSVVTISVDGVRHPDTITQAGQALSTPDNFLDAIMWAACAIAKFADDGQQSATAMQQAEQMYEREKRKLIEWRGEYPGEQRNGPKPSVLRGSYLGAYRKRTSRSGCR